MVAPLLSHRGSVTSRWRGMIMIMIMIMVMIIMRTKMTVMLVTVEVLTAIGFRHSTLRRSRDSKAQDDISVEFPSLR